MVIFWLHFIYCSSFTLFVNYARAGKCTMREIYCTFWGLHSKYSPITMCFGPTGS